MTFAQARRQPQAGLSWKLQCAVVFLAALFVFSRRPDLLTHAHFYAEDGAVWYADAYNSNWLHALTLTAGGYLNTLQRLAASLSLLLPVRYAPLLMNLCGLIVQVLPASFLLSSRCRYWWPLPIRFFQAGLYLLLPNTHEIHILLTNAPFHFALLTFLVAVAAPPETKLWKIFDISVLALGALSGPFCIVLTPLVVLFWWLRRRRWSLVVLAILVPLVSFQATELLLGGYAHRAPAQLGATPTLFLRLLSGHVYLASLWGENGFVLNAHPAAILLVFAIGTSFLAYAFLRSTLELRLFILFAFVLFFAALGKPLIGGALPQWQLLALDRGARYWFFPMLALSWSMLFCAVQRQDRILRFAASILFLALLHGIVRDHRYPPSPDQNFQDFARRFDAAPAGSYLLLPDQPPGQTSYLKKK